MSEIELCTEETSDSKIITPTQKDCNLYQNYSPFLCLKIPAIGLVSAYLLWYNNLKILFYR